MGKHLTGPRWRKRSNVQPGQGLLFGQPERDYSVHSSSDAVGSDEGGLEEDLESSASSESRREGSGINYKVLAKRVINFEGLRPYNPHVQSDSKRNILADAGVKRAGRTSLEDAPDVTVGYAFGNHYFSAVRMGLIESNLPAPRWVRRKKR